MKIEVEQTKDVKTLSVSESISEKEIEVLKVGIKRMLLMENLPLVVDITKVKDTSDEILQDLASQKNTAEKFGSTLLIVGTHKGVCDVSSSDEAEKKINEPQTPEQIEAKLSTKLEVLKKMKDNYEKKLEDFKKDGGDLKTLKNDFSTLNKKIDFYLKTIQTISTDFTDASDEPGELSEKEKKLQEVLESVLTQEEIIGQE